MITFLAFLQVNHFRQHLPQDPFIPSPLSYQLFIRQVACVNWKITNPFEIFEIMYRVVFKSPQFSRIIIFTSGNNPGLTTSICKTKLSLNKIN